jgi:nucleoside-diphosphate-sugar epimerase
MTPCARRSAPVTRCSPAPRRARRVTRSCPLFRLKTLNGKWLGYLSTTGVYGDRQGGWAFEYEPVSPGQQRSIRRAAAEADWLKHGARLFRLAGIYGPGRSAFDRLEADKVVFDVPGHVFSRVHADDIAQAIALSLEQPEAKGAFNLADDWPDTQPHVMTGAAEIAGLPGPRIEPFDPDKASPMQASFYAECRRVSNARAKAALGWRPSYPSWREGLQAIWDQR